MKRDRLQPLDLQAVLDKPEHSLWFQILRKVAKARLRELDARRDRTQGFRGVILLPEEEKLD